MFAFAAGVGGGDGDCSTSDAGSSLTATCGSEGEDPPEDSSSPSWSLHVISVAVSKCHTENTPIAAHAHVAVGVLLGTMETQTKGGTLWDIGFVAWGRSFACGTLC